MCHIRMYMIPIWRFRVKDTSLWEHDLKALATLKPCSFSSLFSAIIKFEKNECSSSSILLAITKSEQMLATFFSSSCHHWILAFSLEASHFGHGWLRKKHLEPLCEVFNLLLNPTKKNKTQAPLNTSNNQSSHTQKKALWKKLKHIETQQFGKKLHTQKLKQCVILFDSMFISGSQMFHRIHFQIIMNLGIP